MRITVRYRGRRYGNSSPSKSYEINIRNNRYNDLLEIDIVFDTAKSGFGANWTTCGSVNGAMIVASPSDAKRLAEAILHHLTKPTREITTLVIDKQPSANSIART